MERIGSSAEGNYENHFPQDIPKDLFRENPELRTFQEQIEKIRELNKIEAQTIYHLLNLTTLGRLNEWNDLDMLFDGEADLGGEETLALHSIIEVFNGKNSLGNLKAPRSISLVVEGLRKNYSYEYDYEEVKTQTGMRKRIRSISSDAIGPMNATMISFRYSEENPFELESMHFTRPGLSINQEIFVTRNEVGNIDSMRVGRAMAVDNKLFVNYDELGRIGEVSQRKLGIGEAIGLGTDTTFFGYRGDEREPSAIMYSPAISLKRTNRAMRKSDDANLITFGVSATLENLKKTKGADIFEIENNSLGFPQSISTQLGASRWYWTGEERSYNVNEDGTLGGATSSQERIGFDKNINVQIEY